MSANPYEQHEPYVSYREVHRWIAEARRVDRRRKRRVELLLFQAVWVLFALVLIGYVVLELLSGM